MATQQTGAVNNEEGKEIDQEEASRLLGEARKNAANGRLAALAEVSDQHRNEREIELQNGGVSDAQRIAEDTHKGVAEDESEVTNAAPEPKTLKLKVDGQELDVELDKVIEAGKRTLQKETAADKRLEEATRILNEAKAQAENLSKYRPSSPDVDETSQPSLETDAATLADTIVNGDKDEVAKALQKVLGATAGRRMAEDTPKMSQAEVYNMVRGALEVQNAMELFKAEPEKGGYGDLYADPHLQKMVMDKEEAITKTTPTLPATERLKQAATEVRQWRDSLIPKSDKVSGFEEVTKQKDSMPTIVSGAGSRAALKPAAPVNQEDRNASALEKMAKARGQRI